jgi:hypothetical protein
VEAARRSACLILALAALAGCGGSHKNAAAAPNRVAASAPCTIDRGVLPKWARTGFSDPEPKMPHVLGQGGDIAAILFGDPLSSPPDPDRGNKVLWVPRETPLTYTRLAITARQGDRTVKRNVDLGPSLVDLPAAGCWQLSLAWKGHEDSLALAYVKP